MIMIKKISMMLAVLIVIGFCLSACSSSSSSSDDLDGTYKLITVGNQGEYLPAEEAGIGEDILTISGNEAYFIRDMTIDKTNHTMTDPAGNTAQYTFDGKTLTLKSDAASFFNEFIFEKQ